jgi:TPR repeat protein
MQPINNSENISTSNTNNLFQEFSQIVRNFDKMDMKEIEPSTKNINDDTYEEFLGIVIDESVSYYFKMTNEGKEENMRKQHILDFINNYGINLREIYDYLLNNQNNPNSIYLLGYFNFNGIGTNINKQKAFELYQKAVELKNNVAQYNLAKMYLDGDVVEKNPIKVFELTKKLAEKEYSVGINGLGYCYDFGIGTNVNGEKAVELYQKAANLGNSVAQYNIAWMYEHGKGIKKDVNQAIYWYKKSAEKGYKFSQTKLEDLN